MFLCVGFLYQLINSLIFHVSNFLDSVQKVLNRANHFFGISSAVEDTMSSSHSALYLGIWYITESPFQGAFATGDSLKKLLLQLPPSHQSIAYDTPAQQMFSKISPQIFEEKNLKHLRKSA